MKIEAKKVVTHTINIEISVTEDNTLEEFEQLQLLMSQLYLGSNELHGLISVLSAYVRS